jgi:hypothetical protein
MSNYAHNFVGDIVGNNANTSVIRDITVPTFGTLLEATTYLQRDGLICYVLGDLYYKKIGVTNPVKLLDSNNEGIVLTNSLKSVSNFRLDSNFLKIDVVTNANISTTISVDVTALAIDVQLVNAVVDANTYIITLIESNGDQTTIALATLIDNYVRNNMMSSNLDLTVEPTKLLSRDTFRTILNNFSQSNIFQVGRGLRQTYSGSTPVVNFGEINPITSNVLVNTKFITSSSTGNGAGIVNTFDTNGSYKIESFQSNDDLILLLSGSRDISSWSYKSANFYVDAVSNNSYIGGKQVSILGGYTNISKISTSSDNNTLFVSYTLSGSTIDNSLVQLYNRTNINRPIYYSGSLGDNITDSRYLIHRGYVDTNFLNISGGTLIGTSGNGFLGIISQSVTPSAPSNGFKLFANNSGSFTIISSNGFTKTVDGDVTSNRNYILPDKSGTVALLSDITGDVQIEIVNGVTGLQNYTGANVIVYVDDNTYHGIFRYDSTDITSLDDGKNILVDINNRRFKRELSSRSFTQTFSNLLSGTSLTLTHTPFDVNSIGVYRNGDFDMDYTILNKTLTFSYAFGNSIGAMGDGEEVIVRYTI